jgi:hypothetical protein
MELQPYRVNNHKRTGGRQEEDFKAATGIKMPTC